APPEGVKGWPLLGERVYAIWFLASTNLREALSQIAPQLKPVGTVLLGYAGSVGISMLQFIAAVAISGFLLLPGPSMVKAVRMIFRRIARRRGDEFVSLAGATVRSLARGVIGVSVLQALLVGIGLIVAGVPAAGLFSFLVLILGIVQIGPLIVTGPLVIWSWTTMDLGGALIFSAYMLPVTVLDNFLRPFVMAHGLKTPMLIILVGVIGGVLTHGVIGLFIGPIVLAIAWELLMAWAQEEPGALKQPRSSQPRYAAYFALPRGSVILEQRLVDAEEPADLLQAFSILLRIGAAGAQNLLDEVERLPSGPRVVRKHRRNGGKGAFGIEQ